VNRGKYRSCENTTRETELSGESSSSSQNRLHLNDVLKDRWKKWGKGFPGIWIPEG
jgi:hypothetical protein